MLPLDCFLAAVRSANRSGAGSRALYASSPALAKERSIGGCGPTGTIVFFLKLTQKTLR